MQMPVDLIKNGCKNTTNARHGLVEMKRTSALDRPGRMQEISMSDA
jgi:hypothetical protein